MTMELNIISRNVLRKKVLEQYSDQMDSLESVGFYVGESIGLRYSDGTVMLYCEGTSLAFYAESFSGPITSTYRG